MYVYIYMYKYPRPPNVPLLRTICSLLDGIWGLLKGSWGVLVHTHAFSYWEYGTTRWLLIPGAYSRIAKEPLCCMSGPLPIARPFLVSLK